MPKKAKPVDDDLDLDEEDTEEEEEEEDDDVEEEDDDEEEDEEDDEEAEDDSEDDEDEEDENDEEEEEEKPVKKAKRGRGRPAGVPNKKGKLANKSGKLGLILRNGIPKKVQIVKVMGKNVKICKPGTKPNAEGDIPGVRYPITEVYMFDSDVFDKMTANAEKMTAISDKNYALLKTLQPVVSNKPAAGKRDPLEDF